MQHDQKTMSPLVGAFRDFASGSTLTPKGDGLAGSEGRLSRFADDGRRVVDFIAPFAVTAAGQKNLAAYNFESAVDICRNFLNWLFAMFHEDETAFRKDILRRLHLQPGAKVCVVGCGLERVCKVGGRVLFGDEGIAAHLRDTEYAAVAITNNRLWASEPPMQYLPVNARDIELTYLLGNCFYLIGFTPGEGLPAMDIDVPHLGWRGGSARTRYDGPLEGVSAAAKKKIVTAAQKAGTSVHDLQERMINEQWKQ